MAQQLHHFEVNAEKGSVSALHQTTQQPIARVILGHGAGANMHHAHMQSLSDALATHGVETLRYHFPYMEAGGGRTDKLDNCLDTIAQAIELAKTLSPSLPLFLAGHSFGGRMSSHYAALQNDRLIRGMIYFSFPLHPAGKPGTDRAAHLPEVKVPQLFLSGDRDKLAELALLKPVITALNNAELHLLDTADHSLKILKRTRQNPEDIYEEVGRVAAAFINRHL